jgi:hypothetical protein
LVYKRYVKEENRRTRAARENITLQRDDPLHPCVL